MTRSHVVAISIVVGLFVAICLFGYALSASDKSARQSAHPTLDHPEAVWEQKVNRVDLRGAYFIPSVWCAELEAMTCCLALGVVDDMECIPRAD